MKCVILVLMKVNNFLFIAAIPNHFTPKLMLSQAYHKINTIIYILIKLTSNPINLSIKFENKHATSILPVEGNTITSVF